MDEGSAKVKTRWSDSLRRYFLAGLLVFLPLAITLWFIGWVIDLLDSVLAVLPDALHPNSYLPFAIPKLGAVVTLLLILFLGVLTRGVATRRFLAAWESIFIQIPVFRGIYTAVQKLVQTFLGQSNAQRQVVMIEYPRDRHVYSGLCHGPCLVASGRKEECPAGQCLRSDNAESHFRILSSRAHQRGNPLNMTMEEALKLITSSGLITPDDKLKINGR